MPKKDYKQLVKQVSPTEAAMASGKETLEGNNPKTNNVDNGAAKARKKSDKKNSTNKKNKKDVKMTTKKALDVANEGKSIYYGPKDFFRTISSGAIVLTAFLSAIDKKLTTLEVPAYIRKALIRPKGQRAANGPFIKPELDKTELIKVLRQSKELNDDDKDAITQRLQDAHDEERAKAKAKYDQELADEQAAHEQDQHEKEKAYYAEQREKQKSSKTRSSSYAVEIYELEEFKSKKGPFSYNAFVAPKFEDSVKYEIVMHNGKYVKLPKKDTLIEDSVTIAEAQAGVAAELYVCPDLYVKQEQLKHDLKEYEHNLKNQDTHFRAITSEFYKALSSESLAAISAFVVGGQTTVNDWVVNNNYLALIDAFYDTHDSSDKWATMTEPEKQAFIKSEKDYLNNVKQLESESIIQFVQRIGMKFELSLKLKSLIGEGWSHSEHDWIRLVVMGTNDKNPVIKQYKQLLMGENQLFAAVLTESFKATFKEQCERLIQLSGENHVKVAKAEKSKGKDNGKKPTTKPSAPADPVVLATKVDKPKNSKGGNHGNKGNKGKKRNYKTFADKSPEQHSVKPDKTFTKPLVTHGVNFKELTDSQVEAIMRIHGLERKGHSDPRQYKRKSDSDPRQDKKKSARVYYNDEESEDGEEEDDDDDDSDDDSIGYVAAVTIATLDDPRSPQAPRCNVTSREACGLNADLRVSHCKGQCCQDRRSQSVFYQRTLNNPSPQRPNYSRAPDPETYTANGYGQLVFDTGSTINMCTEEHAPYRDSIKQLARPIRIRGAGQGMTRSITHYFIHELFGLCLLSDQISILSCAALQAMGWEIVAFDEDKIVIKHPRIQRRTITFHATPDLLYVGFDPTILSSWTRLTGEDRIGYVRSLINSRGQEVQQYRVRCNDSGESYHDPDDDDTGIVAVTVPVAAPEEVQRVASASLVLETEEAETGRLGGKKRRTDTSN